MKLYKSYMFRSKDPAIDVMRTMIQKSTTTKITRETLKAIEDGGGPSAGCMHGWFFGKTKRPQNATLEAAGRAMGKKRIWVENK